MKSEEFKAKEYTLIQDTIQQIGDTIENVDMHIHLYESLRLIMKQDGEDKKATAIKTIIANLKDIQATYRNNASVLTMAFGIREETT